MIASLYQRGSSSRPTRWSGSATGSKYVTLRGGLRRAIPFLLVRSGGCARSSILCGQLARHPTGKEKAPRGVVALSIWSSSVAVAVGGNRLPQGRYCSLWVQNAAPVDEFP